MDFLLCLGVTAGVLFSPFIIDHLLDRYVFHDTERSLKAASRNRCCGSDNKRVEEQVVKWKGQSLYAITTVYCADCGKFLRESNPARGCGIPY